MACSGETLPSRIGGLLIFDIEVRGVAIPRQRGIVLVIVVDVEVVGLLAGRRHLELKATGLVIKIT